MQPLGKEPEPSGFGSGLSEAFAGGSFPSFGRERNCGEASSPAPTACLPAALHLRSPTPTVLPRPFVLEVGSCWVGGSRGKRFPLRYSERKGLSPRLPPSPPQPSPPGPTPSLRVPVPPVSPGVPQFPLPGLRRLFTGRPSRFSATPRSPRRGWGRQKGGGGETTSPLRRGESPGTLLARIPPGPAAEAGFSRHCRGAEGPLQSGGRPARTPTTRLCTHWCAAQPARAVCRGPAWRGLTVRTRAPQVERQGHCSSRPGEANCKQTPLASPHRLSGAPPASPVRRARPQGLPRLLSLL